jgi:glutathione S-transferase
MSLTLYYHPLSSYCHKVLIALYENGTAFTPQLVNLGDPQSAAEFRAIWPIGKFPVLRDAANDRLVPESSIIIEYLDQHRPGRTRFLPADADLARQTRFRDRFYDLHVHAPMQKIVTDRLRPPGQNDRYGVEEARKVLHTALGIVERAMATSTWAMGDAFTLADCAAAPPLFYADLIVAPFGDTYPNVARYLKRLTERPSYARVLDEARPYFNLLPKDTAAR